MAVSHCLDDKRGRGRCSPSDTKRILNIASIASELAVPITPLYCASKWAISGFTRSLMTLEPFQGIRVNAVAPGIVKTPIWTADKLVDVDDTKDKWVTTQDMAKTMLKLVEDPAMIGGTVLEVAFEATRDIPLHGNVGPQGPGHELSNMAASIEKINDWLGTAGWGVATGSA